MYACMDRHLVKTMTAESKHKKILLCRKLKKIAMPNSAVKAHQTFNIMSLIIMQ